MPLKDIDRIRKQDLNLELLLLRWDKGGDALEIFQAIKNNNNKWLATILRDHEEQPPASEMLFRNVLDKLLEYYSYLELAILTGFVRQPLPYNTQQEILLILGHPEVRKYYTKTNSFLLPDLLYDSVMDVGDQKLIARPFAFVEFYLLKSEVDVDVENYLWLLNNGSFGDFNLAAFKSNLAHSKYINGLIKRKQRTGDKKESVFWGFVKYSNYIDHLSKLLSKYKSDKRIAYLLWQLGSYRFNQRKYTFKSNHYLCVDTFLNLSIGEAKRNKLLSESQKDELVREVTSETWQLKKNFEYVMEMRHDENLSDTDARIALQYNTTSLELRMLPPLIKDNNIPKVWPFPGFARLYVLTIVVSDVTNRLEGAIDLKGFPRIGDQEHLPINKTLFYYKLGESKETVAPSQIHVLTTIINSKQDLRDSSKILEEVKRDVGYKSLVGTLKYIAKGTINFSPVTDIIRELAGIVGKYLGKVEDKSLSTIINSYANLNGDFNVNGIKKFSYTTKNVDFAFDIIAQITPENEFDYLDSGDPGAANSIKKEEVDVDMVPL